MSSPHDSTPDPVPGPKVVAFPESAIRHRHVTELRASRTGVIVMALLAALLVLGLSVLGSAWWAARRVVDRIGRVDGAFAMAEASRPTRPATAGRSLNFLIAGLDGEQRAAQALGARSDAIMVLHLDADRRRVWVVSVPRDSWIALPGHGEHKLNAAYSLGGPALFVLTMEQLTGLRMDHLVVVDWTGLRRLTDALGGIPVSLVSPSSAAADTSGADVALTMDGATALPYLSERKRLPNGDFDRMKRQQVFARDVFRLLCDRSTLTDPTAVRTLAEALGDGVRVDTGLTTDEMLGLAASLRTVRPENVVFLTAPNTGTGTEGDASVVRYDGVAGYDLWQAMAHDRMPAFAAAHPELITGEHVR